MATSKKARGKSPVNILEQLLNELLPGNHSACGECFEWKASRDFFDHDFTDLEIIKAEFSHEFDSVVSQVQKIWGKPNFRGNPEMPDYPEWYSVWTMELCYWLKEEGVAYISLRREDKELPFEILLGAISEEGIKELSEYGMEL